MKIELRNTGRRHKGSGEEIYYLYIDNKTDAYPYNGRGMSGFVTTKEAREKHFEILKTIPCAELPRGIKLWYITNIQLLPGEIPVFEIKRWGSRTKMLMWFDFKDLPKHNCKNYMLNPFRLFDKISRFLKKEKIKVWEMDGGDDPVKPLVIEYVSDLQGTIGDKIDIGWKMISKAVNKAQQEQIEEVKNHLKIKS